MKYRPDIDGLRAIAVLAVLLYHVGYSVTGGGFVGVDVFFVISGYLVTQIIWQDMELGRFTFSGFYERRIRRLLPAFSAVLLLSTVVSFLVLLPSDLIRFSANAISALLVASNVWLWRNTGYFERSSEYNPLLHMWSLSVEEQFYILFPVFLIAVRMLFPSRVRWVLVLFGGISLAISIVVLPVRPAAVFFLPVFRAWELLLGSLLALWPVQSSQRWIRETATASGLAMILVAVVCFTDKTPFPGASALLPCLGTALLIRFGADSQAGRLLSWKPMVGIGLISYSLYLWHWPLIVFARHWLARPFLWIETVAIIASSLVLAYFSWRYVERPFRGSSFRISRPRLFAASFACLLAMLSIHIGIWKSRGLPGRFDEATLALDKERAPSIPMMDCFEPTPERLAGNFCEVGDTHQHAADVLIWGDSHSLALLPALDSALRIMHLKAVYAGASGCPPVFDVESRGGRNEGRCLEFGRGVRKALEKNPSITRILLVADWVSYANDDTRYVLSGLNDGSGNREVFFNGIERTFKTLNDDEKAVIIIGQVPPSSGDIPFLMARARLSGKAILPTDIVKFDEKIDGFRKGLDALRLKHHYELWEIAPVFCQNGLCQVQVSGQPLYRDEGHLNLRGAYEALPFLTSLFERTGRGSNGRPR